MKFIFQAMRLFVGDPVWTPFNRPHDNLPARYGFFCSPSCLYILISTLIPGGQLSLRILESHRWPFICRQEYLEAFGQKEAANHVVDAAE